MNAAVERVPHVKQVPKHQMELALNILRMENRKFLFISAKEEGEGAKMKMTASRKENTKEKYNESDWDI